MGEAKILKNVCTYTANNYNIQRGLLTGFVMLYQVRWSWPVKKKKSSRGGKTEADKTIVMKNCKSKHQSMNVKEIKLIKFSGGFSPRRYFR